MVSPFITITLAGLIAAALAGSADAQTTRDGPLKAGPVLAQASPPAAAGQPSPRAAAQEMMAQGMMGPGMMGPGMMGHGMMGGGMIGMPGHMMKVMFAIADTNGDGALSFEEIMAVHKRVFDAIDTNRDGKVTPAELRTFMQE